MVTIVLLLNENNECIQSLKEDLTANGFLVCQNIAEYDDLYIITDNADGVKVANEIGCGYIYYETDENQLSEYKNCQCIVTDLDGLSADFVLRMFQRSKNIPWTIAVTKRLTIKELTLLDIDSLMELYCDEEIQKYCKPLMSSVEDEMEFEASYIKNMYGLYGYGIWNIFRNSDDKLIGRVGFEHRDGYDDIELGYLIVDDCRNKGYAYEACSAVMDWAKKELFPKGVNCFIDEDNYKSKALAEKLGFVHIDDCEFDQKIMNRYRFEYKKFTNF